MVNTIDQAQRRDVLAAAVWELMRRHGLAGATVRAVADETGLSSGAVRHTFPTQAQLYTFAMEALADRIAARVAVDRAITEPLARAEAMVGELLPLTDDSEAELRAWLEFVAASHIDAELSAIAEHTFVATRAFLTTVVDELRDAAAIAADIDVERTVAELSALVDGLTVQLLHSPNLIDRPTAREVLAHRLARPMSAGGRS